LDGVEEDDFTLIFGFPGRTQEYLPSMAVRQVMNTVDPARIGVRDQSLAVIDKYMRADPESRFSTPANSLVWPTDGKNGSAKDKAWSLLMP
jgi:hypothetical protein